MWQSIKILFKNNWKSILCFCVGILFWILVKENILNLSYPDWGYLLFGAIDFDGIDDFVQLGQDLFETDSLGTIALWFKPTDNTINHYIFSSSIAGSTDIFQLQVLFAGTLNGQFQVSFVKSGVTDVIRTTTTPFSLNEWSHVVITSNDSAYEIFVDGVSQELTVVAGSNSGLWFSDLGAGTHDVRLAKRERDVDTVFAKGAISEVGVYNVELSLTDIQQLSNSHIKYIPFQIQPANLRGYWPMDDGIDGTSADGDTVRDLSENGNDGTGDDGANNTGLTWKAEEVLSYPVGVLPVIFIPAIVGLSVPVAMRYYRNMRNG